MTDIESGITNYAYDRLNRLTSLINPDTETTAYEYDSINRRERAIMPNGRETAYTYDNASRLTEMINSINTSTISSYSYTHNNAGNRITMAELDGTHSYAYDSIYRLIQAVHPTIPAESFTYDPVGNRLTSSDYNDWSYDENNRLTGYNGVSYAYDANGNVISKTDGIGTTIYSYDTENRLIRIDYPDGAYSAYKYDSLGRRIEKDVNGAITKYLYDGEDILYELDGSNNVITRYTHGHGIDEPVSLKRGGNSYCYHRDGLGSITGITDSIGTLVQAYTYDSFGSIASMLNPGFTQPYTFTGREYDTESGLYFYMARYYDARVGRFLQADPIGLMGGVNLYVYCLDDPVNWVDPWGLYTFQQFLQETAIYSGIVFAATSLTPGAQTASLVFAGIAIGSVALEISLYSKNPYTDTAKEIIKMILPVKKPYDMFTDYLIDLLGKEIDKKLEEKACK